MSIESLHTVVISCKNREAELGMVYKVIKDNPNSPLYIHHDSLHSNLYKDLPLWSKRVNKSILIINSLPKRVLNYMQTVPKNQRIHTVQSIYKRYIIKNGVYSITPENLHRQRALYSYFDIVISTHMTNSLVVPKFPAGIVVLLIIAKLTPYNAEILSLFNNIPNVKAYVFVVQASHVSDSEIPFKSQEVFLNKCSFIQFSPDTRFSSYYRKAIYDRESCQLYDPTDPPEKQHLNRTSFKEYWELVKQKKLPFNYKTYIKHYPYITYVVFKYFSRYYRV